MGIWRISCHIPQGGTMVNNHIVGVYTHQPCHIPPKICVHPKCGSTPCSWWTCHKWPKHSSVCLDVHLPSPTHFFNGYYWHQKTTPCPNWLSAACVFNVACCRKGHGAQAPGHQPAGGQTVKTKRFNLIKFAWWTATTSVDATGFPDILRIEDGLGDGQHSSRTQKATKRARWNGDIKPFGDEVCPAPYESAKAGNFLGVLFGASTGWWSVVLGPAVATRWAIQVGMNNHDAD